MLRLIVTHVLQTLGLAFAAPADRDRHHGHRWPDRNHYHDGRHDHRNHGRHHKHKRHARDARGVERHVTVIREAPRYHPRRESPRRDHDPSDAAPTGVAGEPAVTARGN